MEELLLLLQNTHSFHHCTSGDDIFTVVMVKTACTFCGEGRGALLDGVELQQQAVQLRQVATQRRVHGNSGRVTTLLFIGETVQSLDRRHQYFKATKRLYG